jgi:hypothetical protein
MTANSMISEIWAPASSKGLKAKAAAQSKGGEYFATGRSNFPFVTLMVFPIPENTPEKVPWTRVAVIEVIVTEPLSALYASL